MPPRLKVGIEINQADLKHLTKKLKILKNTAGKGTTKALVDGVGLQTTSKMKQQAPVDTGRLRTNVSYTTYVTDTRSELIMESEAIDPNTGRDYAPVQEYGLNGLRAQPYFQHNARWGFEQLYKRLTAAITRALKR